MSHQLGLLELTGGVDSHPGYPSMVSMDMTTPIRQLNMYTNNLVKLAAPVELCIQKAIELINDRDNYELNIALFRMDLTAENLDNAWLVDVNSLIAGIRCIGDYLLQQLDDQIGRKLRFFPYQHQALIAGNQLLLSLINVDATFKPYSPTSVPVPAYLSTKLCEETRTTNSTKEYYCIDL